MAGGSGERFWPVSTKAKPKQFLRLNSDDRSLLQEAVERAASQFGSDNTYVATGENLAELTRIECPTVPAGNVLAEPAKRNTAGCILWAAAHLLAFHPSDWQHISMAILTADHRIEPRSAFVATAEAALGLAEESGCLVTIGVRPTRPETGFGYVQTGDRFGPGFAVTEFREKPDLATAKAYVESKDHLWNAGMFFWTLPAFFAEMESAAPELAAAAREMAGLIREGNSARADQVFQGLPNLSIDYVLMEKSHRVLVVESQFEWDDLGAWDALRRSFQSDREGNVAIGPARLIQTHDAIVYNPQGSQQVCLLGVHGLAVIVTEDTILICPAERAQDVKLFSQSEPHSKELS